MGQPKGGKVKKSDFLVKKKDNPSPPIGRKFQAIVLPWDGRVKNSKKSDSDDYTRMGTQIWPPQDGERVINEDKIGKGRSDTCSCSVHGSEECISFHIREEREKLKSELGSAFSSWGFDDMGADVSVSWTPLEETKFEALVRLNPASEGKNVWNGLKYCFRYKKMKEVVSYYFNVFVLRRRAIQNRVLQAEDIDSEDDEQVPVRTCR